MSSTNPSADDHAPHGAPAKEVIDRGYEADVYDSRTVLSVPLLVILFFVLAFGTVTILFMFLAPTKEDPNARPLAVEKNREPLNERLKQNGRGPKSGTAQPRLEPLRIRDDKISPRAITRPDLPVADGNSPELHPEDLRVSQERFPALFASSGTRLGLDRTMGLSNETLKELFPVQKAGVAPAGSRHVPTAANAGRGAAGSVVETPGQQPKPPAPKPPKGDH
jgi:hypothetical protein